VQAGIYVQSLEEAVAAATKVFGKEPEHAIWMRTMDARFKAKATP
jgi:hypothetical protein